MKTRQLIIVMLAAQMAVACNNGIGKSKKHNPPQLKIATPMPPLQSSPGNSISPNSSGANPPSNEKTKSADKSPEKPDPSQDLRHEKETIVEGFSLSAPGSSPAPSPSTASSQGPSVAPSPSLSPSPAVKPSAQTQGFQIGQGEVADNDDINLEAPSPKSNPSKESPPANGPAPQSAAPTRALDPAPAEDEEASAAPPPTKNQDQPAGRPTDSVVGKAADGVAVKANAKAQEALPERLDRSASEPRPVEASTPQTPSRINPICLMRKVSDNQEWAPGLPFEPFSQPIKTGGAAKVDLKTKKAELFEYTDARNDGLMAIAVDRANKMKEFSALMDTVSRQFAIRITNLEVRLNSAGRSNAKFDVEFSVEVKKGKPTTVKLQGSGGTQAGSRLDVALKQAGKAHNYRGLLSCFDRATGCREALLRLDRLNAAGKVEAVAYAVYRWDQVHVTLLNRDMDIANGTSVGHKQFIELFSSIQKPYCEGEPHKDKREFTMYNWAVAYGRGGFKFVASSGNKQFTLVGNLLHRPTFPVSSQSILVQSSGPVDLKKSIEKVNLINNDGAGNINLQVDFKGKDSYTRFRVSQVVMDWDKVKAAQEYYKAFPVIAPADVAASPTR